MSKEKVEKEIRRPSFAEGLIPILFMAFILILGMGILKWPAEICLLLSALFAGGIAMSRLNYDWDKILQLIIEKISVVMPAVLIVIFVGFMVATWSYSGTMGMLVYYGVKFINPAYAFAIAFIACAILSYVSGASWGSVASIGVALMGIGTALQLNLGILAAAIVTGAYFGDKLSPLSDTTNLTSAVNNVKLYDLIKYLLYTTLPATIIAIIMYFILGLSQHSSGAINIGDIQLLTDLTSIYKFGIWPLIPMFVILIGTLMRMPTIPAMLASSVTAILTGAFYQGFDLLVGVKCAMKGFDVSQVADVSRISESTAGLLNGGGLSNQGGFSAFIFCAMAFAGIITGTGMMDVVMSKFTSGIKSIGMAVIISEIQCIIINLLTGSDGLNKIITTEVMTKKFLQLRVNPIVLARTEEDSGTMTSTLVPWSAAGLYMSNTLGVSVTSYLPYCYMFFASIILAAIYGCTKFRIIRITDEEAYAIAKERNILLDDTAAVSAS